MGTDRSETTELKKNRSEMGTPRCENHSQGVRFGRWAWQSKKCPSVTPPPPPPLLNSWISHCTPVIARIQTSCQTKVGVASQKFVTFLTKVYNHVPNKFLVFYMHLPVIQSIGYDFAITYQLECTDLEMCNKNHVIPTAFKLRKVSKISPNSHFAQAIKK